MASLSGATNRAAVYAEPGTTKIEIQELPIPQSAAGEILVRLLVSREKRYEYYGDDI